RTALCSSALCQRRLNKVQPVLTEEHLVPDEEGRCAEHAALDGALGDLPQTLLHRRVIDLLQQSCHIEPLTAEHPGHHIRVAHVLTLHPDRSEDSIHIRLELVAIQQCDGSAHQL